MAEWELRLGDCLDVLRAMGDATVDALVTDPPAGIEFMGKEWDSFGGDSRQPDDKTFHRSGAGPFDRSKVRHGTSAGYANGSARENFIESIAAVMRECLRVLKPGAHGLVWALPRTSHWTATAIEDAGFEIRDVITHHFGSGFPKSLNLGDGRGTALKPASEHWILCRKPLAGTVAANVAEHGTGALNIDACRIGTAENLDGGAYASASTGRHDGVENWRFKAGGAGEFEQPSGRWPANLVLTHSEGCEVVGTKRVRNRGGVPDALSEKLSRAAFTSTARTSTTHHFNADGTEEVENWRCADGCQVRELDEQSGDLSSGRLDPTMHRHVPRLGVNTYGDDPGGEQAFHGTWPSNAGGASRFFATFRYEPKPSSAERDAGLDHLAKCTGGEATGRKDGTDGLKSPRAGAGRGGGRSNIHPTVKSVALMRWLCKLITPPGGLVLDPFAGSGSTGCAALLEGLRFLGIERETEYAEIAEARLRYAAQRPVGGEFETGAKDEVVEGQLKLLP